MFHTDAMVVVATECVHGQKVTGSVLSSRKCFVAKTLHNSFNLVARFLENKVKDCKARHAIRLSYRCVVFHCSLLNTTKKMSAQLQHAPPPFMRGKRRVKRTDDGDMRPGNTFSRVAVVIKYHAGDTNMGKFQFPSRITERQALTHILTGQPVADLDDICEISFSQVANGNARIPWIDEVPHYHMNQEYEEDMDEGVDDEEGFVSDSE